MSTTASDCTQPRGLPAVRELTVTPFDDSIELRQQIIDACRRMTCLGHFIGTWGNIAVRVYNGILVTPSRVEYESMTPHDMVVVDWEGRRIAGEKLPTSELQVHRLLLKRRMDLGAVIHSHAPWSSVLACAGRDLPCVVEDMAQIIGGVVRCGKYVPGGEHLPLAEAAVQALEADSTALLLENHGVVVAGRDLAEAVVAAQVLEKAAMLYVQAEQLGGCKTIPLAAVHAERDRYLFKYGNIADFEGSDVDDSE